MSSLRRRPWLVIGLALGAGLLGCSTTLGIKVGGKPDPTVPATASLGFDDQGILTLPLGGTQGLSFTAAPPMPYRVGLALLGPSLDGSLDAAEVTTGDDGRGMITLHAPTQPTTFLVRASLLDQNAMPLATAERQVSVSADGFGTVAVTPTYLGHRTVTDWTASVVAQTTCATLDSAGVLPGEAPGALTATVPAGADPVIPMAPVGSSLAVAVRAGHFAWGCADATMLTAGATLDVPVAVIDTPLDLADADLSATFAFTADPSSYGAILDDATATLLDAFMPMSSSEGTILLNGMAAGLTTFADSNAFATRRQDEGWDATADQHLSSLGVSLRATCADWASAGLMLQPTSFQADLVGGPNGQLTLTVTQFGDLLPADAGAVMMAGSTWSGLPDDSVLLSGSLSWEPSRFAGAASKPVAQMRTGAPSVAAALAQKADCAGLATALGPFGACDLSCVEALCAQAIATRWSAALQTSQKTGALGSLTLQGSGKTMVGDLAQPITLSGVWQGQLATAGAQLSVKGGSLSATQGQGTP
jgi:hypothetical protein